jgi:hypothetical protein
VTFRAPIEQLETVGLLGYATEQYGAGETVERGGDADSPEIFAAGFT